MLFLGRSGKKWVDIMTTEELEQVHSLFKEGCFIWLLLYKCLRLELLDTPIIFHKLLEISVVMGSFLILKTNQF